MADAKSLAHLSSINYEDFIVELRRDPIEYISINKLTEEDILQCISKIIVTGEIEISHRLQLLIVLQENSAQLLTSDERLEVTVSSLSNFCEQLKNVHDNFFKGQILVTITVVLLDYVNSMTEAFASFLSRHCDRLWKILEEVNNKDSCLVREIAIECLLEIEESFPCIFLSKLEEITAMSFKENLYPFQNYSNLISCVLKNASTMSTEVRTNKILVMMKKSPLIDDINHYTSHSKINTVTTKLLDFVALLSPPAIHYVITNIVQFVKVLQLNPLILKTFIHRYMLTSNTILFSLLLRLKDAFQNDLFSNSEQNALTMLLIDKSSHVSMIETNRILAIFCTRQYLSEQKFNPIQNKSVIESMFYLPQPLDSLRVKENKLGLYAKLLPYFKDKEWHNREFLECINGICSQLLRDDHGHYIVALCRILYHSTLSQNDPILEAEYQRIALSVISQQPHLSMHVLNLIRKIKLVKTNCLFFNHVLSTAVHHVTCLPIGSIQHQLYHYLLFLAEAALENSEYSQPRAILRFLQKVLNENGKNAKQNLSWLSGHALLNVCKHILCYHNSNFTYTDLGELLHTVISQNGDIDVRDRAQFYYMLLTTLSPKKITPMFQQNVQKSTSHPTLTGFVPGDSAYGIPAPVLRMNHPILCLTRSPEHERKSSICYGDDKNVDVDGYFHWLTETGYSWKASLKCSLSIASDADSMYNDIYGTVLSFVGPSFCSEMPNVSVSHLARNKPHTFSLELQAKESRQALISASAIFSTTKGQTCCSKLKPLILEFHHLFQTLPVPFGHITIAESWRKNLANNLWSKFTSMLKHTGSCDYHQSVLYLLLEEHLYLQLLHEELNPFVTDRTPDCSQKSTTVGVFLPPRNHLIIKMRYVVNEGMVVHMATDSRDVLARVNLYFCKLEKKYLTLVESPLSETQ